MREITKRYKQSVPSCVSLNSSTECLICVGFLTQAGSPGLRPTQNFGWVGHNAFGPCGHAPDNWPVYLLVLAL